MTSTLKEHLIRCEKAMESAKLIVGGHGFPDDYRTATVIGFISVLIEHQESVLPLVDQARPGSAFAILRPIVEGAYRALWINVPGTDDKVKKFNQKDTIDLSFEKIAGALDKHMAVETSFKTLGVGHGSISTATLTAGCIR